MESYLRLCMILSSVGTAHLINVPLTNTADTVHTNRMLNTSAASRQYPEETIYDPALVKVALDSLHSTYLWTSNWPDPKQSLGTVSAVAFDLVGNVVVFHRADRVWMPDTFNASNVYQGTRQPINTTTIVAFNRNTGAADYETGANLFFMPHGLTIDKQGALYVTDVALHQVFKFRRDGPTLTKEWELGDQFEPRKFCKPTSVAVLDNGDFFVADGYCHSQIVKFSKDLVQLTIWGKNTFQGPAHAVTPPYYFAVPHSLTLADDLRLLFVADRENGRVQCFNYDGKFQSQFHSPVMGNRVFSVAYAPKDGGQLFVVNGPDQNNEVLGFVVDLQSGRILSKFSPKSKNHAANFENPHDIIVSRDAAEVYVANLFPDVVYKLVNTDIQIYNTSLNRSSPIVGLRNPLEPLEPPSVSTVFLFVMLPLGIVILIGCLVLVVRWRLGLGTRSNSGARNYSLFATTTDSEF